MLAVTLMRILSVVTAVNGTVRLTRLLPVIVAWVTHAEPSQVCTLKAVLPYWLKVRLSVGSAGLAYASCML